MLGVISMFEDGMVGSCGGVSGEIWESAKVNLSEVRAFIVPLV
jgi:hypothetical protein